jgi:hypothetical protein
VTFRFSSPLTGNAGDVVATHREHALADGDLEVGGIDPQRPEQDVLAASTDPSPLPRPALATRQPDQGCRSRRPRNAVVSLGTGSRVTGQTALVHVPYGSRKRGSGA